MHFNQLLPVWPTVYCTFAASFNSLKHVANSRHGGKAFRSSSDICPEAVEGGRKSVGNLTPLSL